MTSNLDSLYAGEKAIQIQIGIIREQLLLAYPPEISKLERVLETLEAELLRTRLQIEEEDRKNKEAIDDN